MTLDPFASWRIWKVMERVKWCYYMWWKESPTVWSWIWFLSNSFRLENHIQTQTIGDSIYLLCMVMVGYDLYPNSCVFSIRKLCRFYVNLTERQTSYCDVKCYMTFPFQWKLTCIRMDLTYGGIFLLKWCKIVRPVFICLGFIYVFITTAVVRRRNAQFTRISTTHICIIARVCCASD